MQFFIYTHRVVPLSRWEWRWNGGMDVEWWKSLKFHRQSNCLYLIWQPKWLPISFKKTTLLNSFEMLSIFNNKYSKPVVPFLKHYAFTYIPNPSVVILIFCEVVFDLISSWLSGLGHWTGEPQILSSNPLETFLLKNTVIIFESLISTKKIIYCLLFALWFLFRITSSFIIKLSYFISIWKTLSRCNAPPLDS